jgi:hypothetical protein
VHTIGWCWRLCCLTLLVGCAATGTSRSAAPVRTETIGSFMLAQGTNPLTLQAAPMLSTFDERQNGMLGWWCLESGLGVLIGLSGSAASAPQSVLVRVAFDSSPPSPAEVWLVQRQNGFPLAYLRPDLIPAFTSQALHAGESRIEVVNPTDNSVTIYRFQLLGMSQGYSRLPCAPRTPVPTPRRAAVTSPAPPAALVFQPSHQRQ